MMICWAWKSFLKKRKSISRMRESFIPGGRNSCVWFENCKLGFWRRTVNTNHLQSSESSGCFNRLIHPGCTHLFSGHFFLKLLERVVSGPKSSISATGTAPPPPSRQKIGFVTPRYISSTAGSNKWHQKTLEGCVSWSTGMSVSLWEWPKSLLCQVGCENIPLH